MQEKITQTSSANSEHKHSEMERFLALKLEQIIVIQSHNRQN